MSDSKERKTLRIAAEKEEKLSLAKQQPSEIAEKIAVKIREMNPNLSPLELSELYIPQKNIQATEEFLDDRKLENLAAFVELYAADLIPSIKEYKKLRNRIKKMENKLKWDKKSGKFKPGNEAKYQVEQPKRKFLCILSPSAIRACDTHRATRDLEGGSLKMIHKNQIKDDLRMLKTTWSRILCGTPGRMDLLLKMDQDSLYGDEIDTVIVDMFLDDKLRTMFDYEELYAALGKMLKANPELKIYLF